MSPMHDPSTAALVEQATNEVGALSLVSYHGTPSGCWFADLDRSDIDALAGLLTTLTERLEAAERNERHLTNLLDWRTKEKEAAERALRQIARADEFALDPPPSAWSDAAKIARAALEPDQGCDVAPIKDWGT